MDGAAWSLEASRREDDLQKAAAHWGLQQAAPSPVTAGLGITTQEYSPGLGIGQSLGASRELHSSPGGTKPRSPSPSQVRD